MRNIYRTALVSVLAFSLLAAPSELSAQTVRRGGAASTASSSTTSTASSSDHKSAATAPSRSSGTSSASRGTAGSTASRSASTSTQERRSSSTARGSSTTSGSSGRRQSTTASGSTANGRTSGTTSSASRKVTPARQGSTGSSSGAASTDSGTQQTRQKSSTSTGRVSRSNANVTSSRGLTSAPEAEKRSEARSSQTQGSSSGNKGAVQNLRDLNYAGSNAGRMKMDDERNLNRVPPRERDHVTYDKAGSFYGQAPHLFGYRVESLPPKHKRVTCWGIDYYYYDNVYYRRYGSYYVVARPPYGVGLEIELGGISFSSVRFAYYHNVYRTFDVIDSNYRTIAEQNREIARNNALLAQQNSALALNSSRALSAYEIASALGLVQSFADIDTEYYYEDGVFYIYTKKGRYEVIVPPAGALVDELPDDYDTIVLNGTEYYKVDDTVYRLVLVDGVPALEVLGQMYGQMASKYNYYK